MMKTLEPHITVRAVQPVVAGLEALGHDVDEILARAPIRRKDLENADGRIPHRTMMEMWRSAIELTGDDNLGIHVALAAPVASFAVHAYALLSSPTLREAYRRGCRYQRLIHESTNLEFDEGQYEGVLRHSLPGGRAVPRHPAEFLATVWVRFGRLVTGGDWVPNAVCFAHTEPADASATGGATTTGCSSGSGPMYRWWAWRSSARCLLRSRPGRKMSSWTR